jgi:hypothetical protein
VQQQSDAERAHAPVAAVETARAVHVDPAVLAHHAQPERQAERGDRQRVLQGVAIGVRQVVQRQRGMDVAGDVADDQVGNVGHLADSIARQLAAARHRARDVAKRVANGARRALLRLDVEHFQRLDPFREAVVNPDGGNAGTLEGIAVAVRDAHTGAQQRRHVGRTVDVAAEAVAGPQLIDENFSHRRTAYRCLIKSRISGASLVATRPLPVRFAA